MKSSIVVATVLSLACSDGITPPPPPPAAAQTSVDSLSFAGAVGEPDPPSQSFDVLSDSSWHATTSADWIRVSPDSGRGDATLEVSIRPLLLVGDITDTIYIAAGPGVAQLPVHLHRTGKPPRGLLYGIPYVDPGWGRVDSIFLAAPDGSSAHALRFPSGWPGGPDQYLPSTLPFWGATFAPGGDSLAFIAPSPNNDPTIFVARTDGTLVGVEASAGYDHYYCQGFGGGAGWSPDGRALSWSCGVKWGGTLLLVTGRPPLDVGDGGIPYWSPDGTWILLGTRLISQDSTRPNTRVALPPDMFPIGWTPDDQIIAFGTQIVAAGSPDASSSCGTGVYTIPRGGGEPKQLLRPDYNYAAFSPDGKKLLARRCSPSPAIELMDADGTNVTWTMPGADWAAWQP